MSVLRWKGQSLQLHRNLAGPASLAVKAQGVLPVYVKLAFTIASCAGNIAGFAAKAWRDNDPQKMPLERVRSLRSRINAAFDQLEAQIDRKQERPPSALISVHAKQAAENLERHGNFGILALSIMEESAELAVPLMKIAEGTHTLKDAKPEIDFESADVRIILHLISESARVCAETTTSAKWGQIRKRFPEEAFAVVPLSDSPADALNAPVKSRKK